MRIKGVLCKESVRLSYKQFTTFFYKDHLYSIILRDKDNRWWLTNVKEKTLISVNDNLKVALRMYFKPYRPHKKRSKYEKW